MHEILYELQQNFKEQWWIIVGVLSIFRFLAHCSRAIHKHEFNQIKINISMQNPTLYFGPPGKTATINKGVSFQWSNWSCVERKKEKK